MNDMRSRGRAQQQRTGPQTTPATVDPGQFLQSAYTFKGAMARAASGASAVGAIAKPNISVVTVSGLVLPVNPSRKYLFIQNQDDVNLAFVGIGVNNQAYMFRLDPEPSGSGAGGSLEFSKMTYVPQCEIYVLGSTVKLWVMEG